MPSIKRKHRRQRREWGDGHRTQLSSGYDFFGGGWGDTCRLPEEQRAAWPGQKIEAEMRQAWSELRDEIMAEYVDTIRRPWAWWVFEQGEPINGGCPYCSQDDEAEALDRMGELTPAALAKAAADPQIHRGVLNDAHEHTFRRRWGWWRFTSPERRDYSVPEAVQLVALERRGGEVLTGREKHIVAHKADDPVYASPWKNIPTGAPHVKLDRAECAALGLPDSFIDPTEESDA